MALKIQNYALLLSFLLITTATLAQIRGITDKYIPFVNEAVKKSGQNKKEILKAIKKCPKEQKDAIAFIVSYMPKLDLQSITAAFLLENVSIAFKAKKKYEWTQSLPDSIFLNEVLPYAIMNESRDNWRLDFFNRFSKYVDNCSDIRSAIDSVNKNIRNELMVDYNTNRKKPDQSPYESIEQRMASCSGLSILLTDAFRSVGIPSRIAGTPNWHDNRGNHNWNEVWIDGQWYFTEYYPNQLNKSWFLSDAGKADAEDREHSIYATSWKPAETHFPLVWDSSITYVHAKNVTNRYVDLYNQEIKQKKLSGEYVNVKVTMFKTGASTLRADDRIETNIDIFCEGQQVGGGRTAGPLKDMNDVLSFVLFKHKTYILLYTLSDGSNKTHEFNTESDDKTIVLFID